MYLVVGLLVGFAIGILAFLFQKKNIVTKWYDWALIVIGALALIFVAQNFVAGFAEAAPRFSWLLLLIVGTPALVCVAAPFVLIRIRNSNA